MDPPMTGGGFLLASRFRADFGLADLINLLPMHRRLDSGFRVEIEPVVAAKFQVLRATVSEFLQSLDFN